MQSNDDYGTIVDLDFENPRVIVRNVDESSNEKSSLHGSIIYSIGFLSLVGALFLLYSFNETSLTNQTSQKHVATWKADFDMDELLNGETMAQGNEIILAATNEYGQFDSVGAPYPWLEDVYGSQIVEPYKNTTFTVAGEYFNARKFTFEWYINGSPQITGEQKADGIYVGDTLVVYYEKCGSYNVTIKAISSDGSVALSFRTLAIVKYVKRELRSLTEDDRDKFLDAMVTLWEYDTHEGRELFGDEFTSLYDFVVYHSLASNDIRCDQFHEGTGFITHHLALENAFENALRAVDPSLTLPYWDFTIEGQTITNAGKIPSYFLEISDIFTDSWFGSVDEDNHIADGRWAHALMPVAKDADMTQNSYGYIRAYWNNNPDPEIGRHMFDACGMEPIHKTIPDCPTHYNVLDSDTIKHFQVYSPSDGHGPLHVQVGGMWGGCTDAIAAFTEKWADLLDANMTTDEVEALGYDPDHWKWATLTKVRRFMFDTAVMGEYFHIYRSLWRSHMCAVESTPHLLECPEKCAVDTPFEECSCQVDLLVNNETSWENVYGCMLNDENTEFFNAMFPQEFLIEMTNLISTASVLEGEMIESASTADPIFWLSHPAIERLLAAKRLAGVTHMGGVNVSKWDVVDGSNETWFSYSYYSLEENENPTYPDAYTCIGHAADDEVLPSRLVLLPQQRSYADANGDGIISNWEYFMTIDPNNGNGNDYVFDNFLWDHCTGAI